MTATATLSRRRLQLSDLTRLSTVGLRTRKLRAGLSALGIAIGVAAIVAVLGLSASSQAGLLNEIGWKPEWVVVEYNGEPLERARYPHVRLSAGDRLEIVRAVAGG